MPLNSELKIDIRKKTDKRQIRGPSVTCEESHKNIFLGRSAQGQKYLQIYGFIKTTYLHIYLNVCTTHTFLN